MTEEPRLETELRPARSLRVAVLAKQVPVPEALELEPDGRLRRAGVALEMNPYCRRAVNQGTMVAVASGGSCTVFTQGPPSAADVLREAVAWGATDGVHLCDPAFAGSDTLATSRALAAALVREGPFDLILIGRNSTDGDTGQVGSEVAQSLDLAFCEGVRRFRLEGEVLRLDLEHDDGVLEVELGLPAVLSVAERLCEPCKVDTEGRAAVPPERIRRLSASDVGPGPWGEEGSRTVVGTVHVRESDRLGVILAGALDAQVDEALRILNERGAFSGGSDFQVPARALDGPTAPGAAGHRPTELGGPDVVCVLMEPGRAAVGDELLGSARRIADETGRLVAAFRPAASTGEGGPGGENEAADLLIEVMSAGGPELGTEDVAAALIQWARQRRPWAILAPGTAFGREVAARTAAALEAGLVGDAIGLDVVDGELVASKPAFAGALVADITCTSDVRLVTVRPGVLPLLPLTSRKPERTVLTVEPRGRISVRSRRTDDDVEVLARAKVVIGVGSGVAPDEYWRLSPLAAVLGAELAATRKVTDKGWAPRSRQVGVTGRSIAPRLYVGVALSGKFNHMVGVRAAGSIMAINADPSAPVFAHADVGIVGDWHDVLPLLVQRLRDAAQQDGVTLESQPA